MVLTTRPVSSVGHNVGAISLVTPAHHLDTSDQSSPVDDQHHHPNHDTDVSNAEA